MNRKHFLLFERPEESWKIEAFANNRPDVDFENRLCIVPFFYDSSFQLNLHFNETLDKLFLAISKSDELWKKINVTFHHPNKIYALNEITYECYFWSRVMLKLKVAMDNFKQFIIKARHVCISSVLRLLTDVHRVWETHEHIIASESSVSRWKI